MPVWQIVYADPRDAADAVRDLSSVFNDFEKINATTIRVSGDIDVVENYFGLYGGIVSFDLVESEMVIDQPKNFQDYYPSGKFSDFTIIANGQRFPVHRIILSEQSQYFKDLLSEYEPAQIEMSNMDPGVLNEMLLIIYGHPHRVSGLITLKLLVLLSFFLVEGVDYESVVKNITIQPGEFQEYIDLLQQLYSEGIPNRLHWVIRREAGDTNPIPDYMQFSPTSPRRSPPIIHLPQWSPSSSSSSDYSPSSRSPQWSPSSSPRRSPPSPSRSPPR